MRFYVRIDGVSDEDLGFLGFTLVGESDQFKLYRDYYGEEFIVDRTAPYMFVDDVNDYEILRARSNRKGIVQPPPD